MRKGMAGCGGVTDPRSASMAPGPGTAKEQRCCRSLQPPPPASAPSVTARDEGQALGWGGRSPCPALTPPRRVAALLTHGDRPQPCWRAPTHRDARVDSSLLPVAGEEPLPEGDGQGGRELQKRGRGVTHSPGSPQGHSSRAHPHPAPRVPGAGTWLHRLLRAHPIPHPIPRLPHAGSGEPGIGMGTRPAPARRDGRGLG